MYIFSIFSCAEAGYKRQGSRFRKNKAQELFFLRRFAKNCPVRLGITMSDDAAEGRCCSLITLGIPDVVITRLMADA